MAGRSGDHSQVIISNVMFPQHANPSGNVHGGEIMKLMDSTAGVAALKYAKTNVVTARVDELEFFHPIHIGNVVTCYGKVIFVGNTSMEIAVTVTVEDIAKDEPPKTALTSRFTFVALDEDGRPQRVPDFIPADDEERRMFEEGKQRYLACKQRKAREISQAKE